MEELLINIDVNELIYLHFKILELNNISLVSKNVFNAVKQSLSYRNRTKIILKECIIYKYKDKNEIYKPAYLKPYKHFEVNSKTRIKINDICEYSYNCPIYYKNIITNNININNFFIYIMLKKIIINNYSIVYDIKKLKKILKKNYTIYLNNTIIKVTTIFDDFINLILIDKKRQKLIKQRKKILSYLKTCTKPEETVSNPRYPKNWTDV